MSRLAWDRIGASTGIVSVLLFAAAFAIAAEAPPLGQTNDAAIRSFLVDHSLRLRAASLVLSLSSLFLLWFLGTLRSSLIAAEGQPGELTAIAFGAGLLTVATYLVAAGIAVQGIDSSAALASYDDATLRSIFVTRELAVGPVGVGTVTRAALVGAASLVILRFGGLPKWLGWTGIVVAAASLVGLFTLIEPRPQEGPIDAVWFLSWLAFHVWLLAASIVLVSRPPAGAPFPRTRGERELL